jgi:hypothetical protein
MQIPYRIRAACSQGKNASLARHIIPGQHDCPRRVLFSLPGAMRQYAALILDKDITILLSWNQTFQIGNRVQNRFLLERRPRTGGFSAAIQRSSKGFASGFRPKVRGVLKNL